MARNGYATSLAYYEDAMAFASWLDGQGYPEDAKRVRESAMKIRPELAGITTKRSA